MVQMSPFPLYTGMAAFFFTNGFIFWLNKISYLFFGDMILIGLIFLLMIVIKWFSAMMVESLVGYHTQMVKKGLNSGFFLFLASEVMLFFGFFWAFFTFSLSPTIIFGGNFPPTGIIAINAYSIPYLNTLILVVSGINITWGYKALSHNFNLEVLDSFILTIILGIFFLYLQLEEYYTSFFNFSDSVYGCSFFMLTGLHGMHVFLGVLLLIVSMMKMLNHTITLNNYMFVTMAMIYWHFVDLIWLYLYFFIYIWAQL